MDDLYDPADVYDNDDIQILDVYDSDDVQVVVDETIDLDDMIVDNNCIELNTGEFEEEPDSSDRFLRTAHSDSNKNASRSVSPNPRYYTSVFIFHNLYFHSSC